MMKKLILALMLSGVLFVVMPFSANAQCPMCKSSVESSINEGGNKGRGLNNGILYLLAAPYVAVAGVGLMWYRNYRRKNININIPDQKLNLN
ncbi:hypothetical protein [Solitalea lacus]|uniref:hypothetical protein n=1 Tax=Solitalea lacus TaxID=2911172 RepID=UPI001EDADB7D|nr:hypothetical protein [Solitalea lacus]UKJ07398.1 hypothetical protein L2B55_17975 [Solitalea lacus]